MSNAEDHTNNAFELEETDEKTNSNNGVNSDGVTGSKVDLENGHAASPCNTSGDNDSAAKSKHEDILYTVEDNPPIITSIVLGLQHYLMTISGFGLLLFICGGMCMFETEAGLLGRAQVLSTALFVNGIGTFLQTTFGVRLPVMQGIGGVFVVVSSAIVKLGNNKCPSGPMNPGTNGTLLYNDTDGQIVDGTELWRKRMREIQGSIAIASVVEFVIGLTGLVGVLTNFIRPISFSTMIMLIGVGLFRAAALYSSKQWGVSILTSVVIILFTQYLGNLKVPVVGYSKRRSCHMTKKQVFKLTAVLVAFIVGWVLSAILTATGVYTDDKTNPQYRARTDARLSVLYNSAWFRWPYPGQWGAPTLSAAAVIGMIAAIIGGTLESVADYHASAKAAGAPPPPMHAINRGIAMEGFLCFLNGVMGTGSATTSYSQNNGAIAITRVGSRRVLQASACIMVFLGLFAKFGAVIVLIPDPVIGGVLMVVFSMIVSVGLSNLNYVKLHKPRNVFILGYSLFMGIMISEYFLNNPNTIDTGVRELDHLFTIFLQIPLIVGGVISIFLDLTLRDRDERVDFAKQDDSIKERYKTVYDLPFPTNCCRLSKYFPFLPEFRKN